MEKEIDIFKNLGVEVELPEPDNFLKIKETLSRVGIPSRKDNTLFQSCHILHKQGRYCIMHFKELFIFDGKENNFSEEDLARRNTIANLLEEWNLVKVLDQDKIQDPVAPLKKIKILPFKDKPHWNLESKYTIGKK